MKAIDLGLSVYWGETSLKMPNEHYEERFFTWGDTSHYYTLKDVLNKFDYDELVKNDFIDLIKYDYKDLVNNSIISEKGYLTRLYDHAYIVLGEKWRMPTVEEFNELVNKCEWHWVGDGYVVTGPNKNSIKLPYDVSYRDSGQRVIEDVWYEGEVEKKVFSKEIRSFWSSEPSYDDVQDGLVNESYVLCISNPESKIGIRISSENRGKKNLIMPVTCDKSLLIGENIIPLTKQKIKKPWFMDMGDLDFDDNVSGELLPPPVIPNGTNFPLPMWNKLSDKLKAYLNEAWDVKCENDYNKLLNNIDEVLILEHHLKCCGLI